MLHLLCSWSSLSADHDLSGAHHWSYLNPNLHPPPSHCTNAHTISLSTHVSTFQVEASCFSSATHQICFERLTTSIAPAPQHSSTGATEPTHPHRIEEMVCSFTPSSAATTSTTTSVTLAPELDITASYHLVDCHAGRSWSVVRTVTLLKAYMQT